VLNADGHRAVGRAARSAAPVTFVGTGATADVRAGDIRILGHVSELGPGSPQHHTELGSAAADAGVRSLIAVDNADPGRIVSTTVAHGVEDEHVPDAPPALELVRRRWAAGDVVPVKGAHALGLESLAQQLEVDGATQDHANAERNAK